MVTSSKGLGPEKDYVGEGLSSESRRMRWAAHRAQLGGREMHVLYR
jgi:hypothetical protein